MQTDARWISRWLKRLLVQLFLAAMPLHASAQD